jgi:hypothetical protein
LGFGSGPSDLESPLSLYPALLPKVKSMPSNLNFHISLYRSQKLWWKRHEEECRSFANGDILPRCEGLLLFKYHKSVSSSTLPVPYLHRKVMVPLFYRGG